MTVTIEKSGRRYYFLGNTFPIRDQLRDAGCNWDADRRAWWTSKSNVAAKFSGEVEPVKKTEAELIKERSDRPCTGKAEYKGRTYYIIGTSRDGARFLLTTLDCSIEFWASREESTIVKTYQARSRWAGYGRGQQLIHQTVGGIRRFIEQSREDEAAIKRGEIPDGYCVDLEDGAIKRRSECDMPSE